MSAKSVQVQIQLSRKAAGQVSFSLDVDLVLPGNGITAIFGHSGSGKTTLLRCIAGLEKARQGLVNINGHVWQQNSDFLPCHKRPLGYVFQESSLFDHLTAKGNLQFARKRAPEQISSQHYQHVLDVMGIEPLLNQYPRQLSGGERQRVAIARSLLIQPEILLMDEPLASLDQARKQEILSYLQRLRQEFELPILYISHSMNEVAQLADYLVVLEQGKIVKQGPLAQVLSEIDFPLHPGEDNSSVIEVKVVERDERWHLIRVVFDGGEFWLPDSGESSGQIIRIQIMAKDVSLTLNADHDSSILNRLSARVLEIADDNQHAMALIRLQVGQATIVARITRRSVEHLKLTQGSTVWAQIKSVAMLS